MPTHGAMSSASTGSEGVMARIDSYSTNSELGSVLAYDGSLDAAWRRAAELLKARYCSALGRLWR